jgi:DnaJ-class molecular chaperone
VQQQEQVPSKHRCKEENADLDAQIEQGMDNGSEIKFPRMSEQSPGMIPGDILLAVKQKPHKTFKRQGNDLKMDVEITLKEALLGFSKKVVHLDEHEVTVKKSSTTMPNEIMKIKEEGMPVHGVPSQHGDLFVKLKIQMPKTLTADQKAALEKIC